MGGVAPNAHILFYGNYGSTVEFVAVYDQMLLDKVDAVNISQGHAGWLIDGPRHHPVALAQSAAAEAGLVTVASSGNAGGNGRASLSGAWKYSDDILVVGNTTTTGSFEIGAEAQGDELPAELANLVLTPVSSPLPPADVQGELYFVPTGNGCNADTGAKDKIAVVVYFNDNGTVAGGCALAARVTAMQQSGAMGLIIVSRNAYLGVPGPVANLAIPVWSIGRRGWTCRIGSRRTTRCRSRSRPASSAAPATCRTSWPARPAEARVSIGGSSPTSAHREPTS